MEEPRKPKLTPNELFPLWGSSKNQFNPLQSHRIVVERQWQETIDPQKLLLGKVIGRGSFGVVHKGSYDGQTVAVKVLDFGDTKITEASMAFLKEDFIKEVNAWQTLDHPNITKMIGATMSMTKNCRQKNKKMKTESNFCIVCEYVKGGSLRSYLLKNRNKKLPFKTFIRFALDIAKGLSYLHSKKVIHRDVKPENMLIDKQHMTIKHTDFGESIFEPSELLYTTGERGTRGFMAPEVVSRKPYGRKCDVYSFGICLWEIYNCDIAYTYNLDNLTPDIYQEMRPSIPMDCPRSLAHLMERCWDKDPGKRPEMKEVVVQLEAIERYEGCQMTSEELQLGGCFGFGLFRLGRNVNRTPGTVRNSQR
ncbi:unnamed protein product [Lactuca saligna]|uniref:Protein kinase domain-containing protein n=1 Tax=Lactuca saligna TaxID=75948 RepID=A0AA35YKN7_LACSI|nr:unnamed protein product [Lactuca saligna]